jgi:hypothetical protein
MNDDFPYQVNVVSYRSEDYIDFLLTLKFKVDYDIISLVPSSRLETLLNFAEYICFKDIEDVLAFRMSCAIYDKKEDIINDNY